MKSHSPGFKLRWNESFTLLNIQREENTLSWLLMSACVPSSACLFVQLEHCAWREKWPCTCTWDVYQRNRIDPLVWRTWVDMNRLNIEVPEMTNECLSVYAWKCEILLVLTTTRGVNSFDRWFAPSAVFASYPGVMKAVYKMYLINFLYISANDEVETHRLLTATILK